MKTYYLTFLLLLLTGLSYGQEEEQHEEHFSRHGLSFTISHAYISQGIIDGEREWLSAPAFGLNYNFRLSEKWILGLHNDIIIESFIVENPRESEDILEREFPVSNILVTSYEILKSWYFSVGAGVEWERNENFGLIRIGTEYGMELQKKGLEVVFSFNYDALIDGYDSFNFGLGISKQFR